MPQRQQQCSKEGSARPAHTTPMIASSPDIVIPWPERGRAPAFSQAEHLAAFLK
jgi:hypothetical protein